MNWSSQRFQPGSTSCSAPADHYVSLLTFETRSLQQCRHYSQHVQARSTRRRTPHLRAFAAAAQATGANLQQFHSWLQSKGIHLDKQLTAPAESSGAGSSLLLRSKRSSSRGESLFSVPDSSWVTPKVVKASAIGPLVAGLDLWLQLALFLMFERQQGSASSWQGYLSSLPAQVDTPLSWSSAELQPLQGSQLMSTLEGYR